MNYIKYARTFVMMEEQTSDFASRRAPVKGYLKVETGNNKGALRCVVQNLKYYGGGEYIYKLIFFGKKGDRTINTVLGSLAINRNGNGETYFRFDPLNFDSKGNSYGDFDVAIIAAVSGHNTKEPLHSVLKGSISKERYESSLETEELPEEEPVEINEEIETKDVPEIEDALEIEDIPEIEGRKENNYNSFYNEYLLQFCGYTCRVSGYYQEVYPFRKDLTGARWKRINNVASLPLVSPGAHFFATQYRHFLFGAKPDNQGVACRYFFAVPGRFIQEEQPDGGRSGFVFWQPVSSEGLWEGQEADDRGGPYGYWIVAVDAYTGDIVEV